MSRSRLAVGLWAVLLATVGVQAGALLEPQPAPEWRVATWLNGDPGRLADQRGRVVLIEFFQLWCPGSNAFSNPLFAEWHARYGDRDDVLVVSIHAVFERHERQSPERLREFVRQRGIRRPVGIDEHTTPGGRVPTTMERFATEGSPHVVIVDRDGQIVFSHFGRFEPAPVEAFVERLLKRKPDDDEAAPPRRRVRAGEGR